MRSLTRWLCGVVVGCLLALPARAGDRPSKPVREWSGSFAGEEAAGLRKKAPTISTITTQKEWAQLWMAWRGKEDLPKVDFSRQVILVGTAPAADNKLTANFRVTDTGDLRGGFTTPDVRGVGFAYKIVLLDLDGIKTYNGRPFGK